MNGHFVGGPPAQEPTRPDVEPLGVLTHHHEVDVLGPFVLQGRLDTGIQLHRAQVNVLVELEAGTQQDAALQDSRFDVGVPDGPQIQGVLFAKLVEG